VNVAADEREERDESEPVRDSPTEERPELAVPKSRAGQAWKSLVPALVVVQNLEKAKVSFLIFSGRFPLALALLVAAALGALVVFCLGSVRIVQLRKAFRRHQEDHKATRGKR
jgi:uncharacterized integral membrane protein